MLLQNTCLRLLCSCCIYHSNTLTQALIIQLIGEGGKHYHENLVLSTELVNMATVKGSKALSCFLVQRVHSKELHY